MQTNRFATQHITWRERTTAHSELILLICANPVHEGMGSYFVHYWLPPCLPVPHSLIHYKLAAHLAELLLYCCTIQCSPRKEEEHESKNKRLKHRKCINWPVMSTIKVKVCTTRCTKNTVDHPVALHCCIQKKRCVSYLVAFMLVGWWMVRK